MSARHWSRSNRRWRRRRVARDTGRVRTGRRTRVRCATPASGGCPGGEPAGDVRAAPFVRQLAKERGIDLATISGTGPGGRITRADVEAAGEVRAVEPKIEAPEPPMAPVPGERRVSVVGLRKAIARQMVRSVSTIPQFTEFAIFDATALVEATGARQSDRKIGHPTRLFRARALQPALRPIRC